LKARGTGKGKATSRGGGWGGIQKRKKKTREPTERKRGRKEVGGIGGRVAYDGRSYRMGRGKVGRKKASTKKKEKSPIDQCEEKGDERNELRISRCYLCGGGRDKGGREKRLLVRKKKGRMGKEKQVKQRVIGALREKLNLGSYLRQGEDRGGRRRGLSRKGTGEGRNVTKKKKEKSRKGEWTWASKGHDREREQSERRRIHQKEIYKE